MARNARQSLFDLFSPTSSKVRRSTPIPSPCSKGLENSQIAYKERTLVCEFWRRMGAMHNALVVTTRTCA